MDDSKFKNLIALKTWAAWEIFSDPDLLEHARKVFQEKIHKYNNGSEALDRIKRAEWIARKLERMSRLDQVSSKDMLQSQKEKKRTAKEIVRNGLGIADMCAIWKSAGYEQYPDSLRQALAVRNEIIENYKGFAVRVLQKTVGPEVAANPDLISAALEGLTKGADFYDPAKKVKFATYAALWIRKAIFAEIRAQMEVPETYALVFSAIRNSLEDGVLDVDALEELTGLPRSTVKAGIEIYQARTGGVSLDAATSPKKEGEGRTIHEYIEDTKIPSPEDAVSRKEIYETMRSCISKLPPKERSVLEERLSGSSFREIAEKLGISPSRVCRLEKKAVRRLRAEMCPG
jgi:RNA polymerase sigma factor (sigma-70 family)